MPYRCRLMNRAAPDPRLATARRVRLLRWLGPLAALVVAAATYGLHHTPPLDDHGALTALLAIATAAVLLAVVPATASQTAERRLPMVVAVERGAGVVRPARDEDLDFCVALHAATLDHGFFPQLGRRFMRAYLSTYVTSPHATAWIVTARDAPVGMVVGVLQPGAHGRWVLRRHGLRLAALGASALAVRPRLAARFARTRLGRYRRAWRRAKGPAQAPSPAAAAAREPAVLSHVAVVPGTQGTGFGAQLVATFVDAARAAGCDRVILTTLADDRGAAGFYHRVGWQERPQVAGFDGQPMRSFSLALAPDPEEPAS